MVGAVTQSEGSLTFSIMPFSWKSLFSIIVVFDRQWDLHGSCFRWSNMLFRVEMQFTFPLSYTVIKNIRMICIVSGACSFESYERNIWMPEYKVAMFSPQSPITFSSSGSLKPTSRVKAWLTILNWMIPNFPVSWLNSKRFRVPRVWILVISSQSFRLLWCKWYCLRTKARTKTLVYNAVFVLVIDLVIKA